MGKMRIIAGMATSYMYSASQFIAETASLGMTVYNRSKNIAGSIISGAVAGVVGAIAAQGFVGPVIKKNVGGEKTPEDDVDLEAGKMEIPKKPKVIPYDPRRKYFISTAMIFAVSRLFMYFINNYDMYMGSKDWGKGLRDDKDIDVNAANPLSYFEVFGLLVWTLLITAPFVATNEIYESSESIGKWVGAKDTKPPYAEFLDVFFPFSRLIRWTGSVGHTVETMPAMLILIPPTAIRALLRYSPALFGVTAATGGIIFLLVSGTSLAQTYFFEGNYTEDNLNRLKRRANPIKYAEEINEEESEKRHPLQSYYLNKGLYYLLYTQGPLHGLNDALPIILTLMPVFGKPAAYVLGCTVGVFSTIGTHFSEVAEAQDQVTKIMEEINEQNVDLEKNMAEVIKPKVLPRKTTKEKLTYLLSCCGYFRSEPAQYEKNEKRYLLDATKVSNTNNVVSTRPMIPF